MTAPAGSPPAAGRRTPPRADQGSGSVQAVRQALQLLKTFDHDRPEWGVADLCARFGYRHRSTVSRLMTTLAAGGLVEWNPATSRYRLGLVVLELAGVLTGGLDVRAAARRRWRRSADAAGDGEPRRPVRAPQANAFAERWVGTVSRECPDWLLIFDARHLQQVLRAYADHYNRARPHRGRGLHPPLGPSPPHPDGSGPVCRRDRLGGPLHEYERGAA